MGPKAGKTGKSGMGFYRRNERDRNLFIAAAGLAFSLLVILLVVVKFRSDKDNIKASDDMRPVPQPVIGTVALLTIAKPVTAGTKLSTVEINEVHWPRASVPEGAVFDRSELQDMYAKDNIPAEVPITRKLLTKEPTEISIPVRAGYRAFAIEVDDVGSVDNKTIPGSFVDVILTYHENGELTTKVVVENAKVLSVGGETKKSQAISPRGVRRGKTTLSLELVPADALKLATATQMGRLNLVMRPPDDPIGGAVTVVTGLEVGKTDKRTDTASCSRGIIKATGVTYRVNCDGTMTEIKN